MPLWAWALLCFVAVYIFRAAYYFALIMKIAKLNKLCVEWGDGKDNNFEYSKYECRDLIYKADLSSGMVHWSDISPKRDALHIANRLYEAHLVYWYKFVRAVKPWFLMKDIFMLPIVLLRKVDRRGKVLGSPLFLGFVTIIWWAVTFVINLYGVEIKVFLTPYLEKLFSNLK